MSQTCWGFQTTYSAKFIERRVFPILFGSIIFSTLDAAEAYFAKFIYVLDEAREDKLFWSNACHWERWKDFGLI